MAFLDQSQEEAIREEREREEARQRELEQAKALADEQKRRALAQARTAKIFKIAGACLFVLLCISLYLMNIAIESQKEVKKNIFQLAARSTATAERSIDNNNLFESLAWFYDASELAREDEKTQKYVSDKIRSIIFKLPILAKIELMSSPVSDLVVKKDKAILVKLSSQGFGSIDELDLNSLTISSMINDFGKSRWFSLSQDGKWFCSCQGDNDLSVINLEERSVKKLQKSPGVINSVAGFIIENKRIAFLSTTDTTKVVIYNLLSGIREIDFDLGEVVQYPVLEYIGNNNLIAGGNYSKGGQNLYKIYSLNMNKNKIDVNYKLNGIGKLTSHEFSSNKNKLIIASNGVSVNTFSLEIVDTAIGNIVYNNKNLNSATKLIENDTSGYRFVTVDEEDNIYLWDGVDMYSRVIPALQNIGIKSVAFSPLGTHLMVLSDVNGLSFYDTGTLKESLPNMKSMRGLLAAGFSKDENLVLTSNNQGFNSSLSVYKIINPKINFLSSEQSSEWEFLDWPGAWHGPKENATDGDLMSIIHTKWRGDDNPYWVGKLVNKSKITSVEIINRPRFVNGRDFSGARGQMANYLVSILDDNKRVVWSKKILDSSDVTFVPKDKVIVNINKEVIGSYVKVECYENSFMQNKKTLSFAEVYVYGENGLNQLENSEIFRLVNSIKQHNLNEKGVLVPRNIAEINNNYNDISETNYYKKLIGKKDDLASSLFRKLKLHSKQKNWPAFISTYNYLANNNLVNKDNAIQKANALLSLKNYEESYLEYTKNIKMLSGVHLSQYIALCGHLNKPFPKQLLESLNNELFTEYPELYFYSMRVDGINVNSKDSELRLNKKLPAFYEIDENLDVLFEKSFAIELFLNTDVDGIVLYNGGLNFTDGFSVWCEGNTIYSVFQNTITGEKAQLESVIPGKGFYEMDSLNSNWVRVMINWDSGTKNISMFINGIEISEGEFAGPLNTSQSVLTLGGNTSEHNYGNVKIISLKVWDKAFSEHEVADISKNDGAIIKPSNYSVLFENLQSKNLDNNLYVISEKQEADAYGQTKKSHSYLKIDNQLTDEVLIKRFMLKSIFAFSNKKYTESLRYLKFSLICNRESQPNQLQGQLAKALSKKHSDNILDSYITANPKTKLSDWESDILLSILKGLDK